MKKSVAFVIIATFLLAIITGAFLLWLPISTHSRFLTIEDAFFTSTSAVTVTGLIVVDTAKYFTFFGKIVILVLIQFGGLGFMTFSTLIILLIGKSISVKDKFIIENEFTAGNYQNIKDLIRKIFLFTFIFESAGAIFLFIKFSNLELEERIFSSIFHAVSAFCNAGFSIFSNSFENYTSDVGINGILSVLIFAGGIGFLVLNELYFYITRKIKSISKFSLHSKLVISTSLILIMTGSFVIFIEELFSKGNNHPLGTKLLYSFFQSITARTAGFNTINLNYLSLASIFILLFLMFVGASPGSTGGGVKTSSIGMVLAYLRSRIRGRKNVSLYYRNIPSETIEKVFLVIFLALFFISVSFLFLLSFEKTLKMTELLFETISAFGTVGLSLGITPELTWPSKIVIILTMFIGRIGPLTLFIALSKRESKAIFNYPEENIMIG